MVKLAQLENIGFKFIEILHKEGIETQEQLLAACCLPNKRLALAQKTGINPKLICKWATQADLARIKGIGEEYAELLECCAIDSVQTLASWRAVKLLPILENKNDKHHLVRNLPSLNQVESWISQAKTLPVMVE